MQPEEKQKKKWKTPHTFVILVAIIIIAAIATYLPVKKVLEQENIFVMDEHRAMT